MGNNIEDRRMNILVSLYRIGHEGSLNINHLDSNDVSELLTIEDKIEFSLHQVFQQMF